MDTVNFVTTTPAVSAQSNISSLPDEVRCKYPSKRCENHRALKRSGDLHRFCEFHRAIANRNQRRLDQRRRPRQRKNQVVVTAAHHQLLPPRAIKQELPAQSQQISLASMSSDIATRALVTATPVRDEDMLLLESFLPTTEIPSFDAMLATPQKLVSFLPSLDDIGTLDLLVTNDLGW